MKMTMDSTNKEDNHSLAHLFLHGQAKVTILVVKRRNEMVSMLQSVSILAQMMTKLLTQ
jgi:hypothetical protein